MESIPSSLSDEEELAFLRTPRMQNMDVDKNTDAPSSLTTSLEPLEYRMTSPDPRGTKMSTEDVDRHLAFSSRASSPLTSVPDVDTDMSPSRPVTPPRSIDGSSPHLPVATPRPLDEKSKTDALIAAIRRRAYEDVAESDEDEKGKTLELKDLPSDSESEEDVFATLKSVKAKAKARGSAKRFVTLTT
jgi:hypothetical protein